MDDEFIMISKGVWARMGALSYVIENDDGSMDVYIHDVRARVEDKEAIEVIRRVLRRENEF